MLGAIHIVCYVRRPHIWFAMVGIFSVTFALFCLEDMRVFFSAKHRKRKVKKYSAYACRAFTGGRKGIYRWKKCVVLGHNSGHGPLRTKIFGSGESSHIVGLGRAIKIWGPFSNNSPSLWFRIMVISTYLVRPVNSLSSACKCAACVCRILFYFPFSMLCRKKTLSYPLNKRVQT